MAREHLNRLSEMDATVAGTAQFIGLFMAGQLLFAKTLEKGQWASSGTLPTQQANILKTHIQQLLENCLKLQHFFVGLGPVERSAVKQFHLKVLGLNLVYVVKGAFYLLCNRKVNDFLNCCREQRIGFIPLSLILIGSRGNSKGATEL